MYVLWLERGILSTPTASIQPIQQLYDGAIYLHQGESYLVTDMDLAQRVAMLKRQDVTYYTQVCFLFVCFS